MEIKLPELGEGITTATVAELHFGIGDHVTKEDDLLEVVTDKATFNVPCEEDGVIEEIYVQVGDRPNIGDCLLKIKTNVSA